MTIRHTAHLPQQVRGYRQQRATNGLSTGRNYFLSCDSSCKSSHAYVGDYRQQESCDHNLEGIYEVRHDSLVDDIESHCEKEHFTNTSPAVFNEVIAGCGIRQDRP